MVFVKDDPRINREGRPKGSRDFATDFDEAVEEIAKDNNITKSEARKTLLKVAYKNAKEGNFNFYKDIHDRVYGTATNKVDVTTDGEKINVDPKKIAITQEYEEKLKKDL
jgi:hypothetical protein